jgi:radical SAM superfamily enzyme YgiQ (UPF0313 family)
VKILFTHGYFLEEDEKEKLIMKPYVPLGILYVSAYIGENSYPNEVFDSTFSSFEKQKQKLLDFRPDVLAVYTNLMTKLNVLRLIRFVRSEERLRQTKIVLGGPEVRNHASAFLSHGADVIVIGEGEETMLDTVKYFEGKLDSLNAIPGIAWKNEAGGTIINPERELLRSLDQLPMPAREKIDLQSYFDVWKKAHGESTISVSTMRGCPYTCKWCSRAVYGLSYRRRSPALVADEIAQLKSRYNFDSIWFVDDVFTISHKWLREFAAAIERRQLKIRYEIITRADRMNEEVIRLLVKSGCYRVWIGAESGSQKIIDAMDRRVDVKQVRDMIRLARKHGLQAGTFIMLGYPGETQEDIRETIRHLAESAPDFYTLTIAYPIKGTPLYEETEKAFVHPPAWALSTDRDIDFKRTYPRRYYNFAIRWVNNEVEFSRAKQRKSYARMPLLRLKSLAARGGMLLSRIF